MATAVEYATDAEKHNSGKADSFTTLGAMFAITAAGQEWAALTPEKQTLEEAQSIANAAVGKEALRNQFIGKGAKGEDLVQTYTQVLIQRSYDRDKADRDAGINSPDGTNLKGFLTDVGKGTRGIDFGQVRQGHFETITDPAGSRKIIADAAVNHIGFNPDPKYSLEKDMIKTIKEKPELFKGVAADGLSWLEKAGSADFVVSAIGALAKAKAAAQTGPAAPEVGAPQTQPTTQPSPEPDDGPLGGIIKKFTDFKKNDLGKDGKEKDLISVVMDFIGDMIEKYQQGQTLKAVGEELSTSQGREKIATMVAGPVGYVAEKAVEKGAEGIADLGGKIAQAPAVGKPLADMGKDMMKGFSDPEKVKNMLAAINTHMANHNLDIKDIDSAPHQVGASNATGVAPAPTGPATVPR